FENGHGVHKEGFRVDWINGYALVPPVQGEVTALPRAVVKSRCCRPSLPASAAIGGAPEAKLAVAGGVVHLSIHIVWVAGRCLDIHAAQGVAALAARYATTRACGPAVSRGAD